MPVFIRPKRVTVDQGGDPFAAIAAVVVTVIVVCALLPLIDDVVNALLIVAVVAVLGSLAVLAIVLRRTGVALRRSQTRAAVKGSRRPVAAAAERPAVESRRVVPGVVLAVDGKPRRQRRLSRK